MTNRTDTPTAGGHDGVRVAVLLLLLPLIGPPLLLGLVWLALWHLASRRAPLGRLWLLPCFAASALPFSLASLAGGGGPLAAYLAAHNDLGVAAIQRAVGISDTFDPGLTPLGFVGAVAPVWLPLSAAGAVAAGWFTRPKGSPLLVREAAGVEVPRRVEKRLAAGVTHPPDGWALGYTPEGRQVTVSDLEARHHVAVCGATGSGKTTVLLHLVAGVAHRSPLVIVDCKASRPLRRAVERIPGAVVWEFGGPVRWDGLRGDYTTFASKLMAAEEYGRTAAVYRAAAQRYLQWVGQVLDAGGVRRDPGRIAELLTPRELQRTAREISAARQRAGEAPPAVLEQVLRLSGEMGDTAREGLDGFAGRFGVVAEGVAGASLGAGPGALVLEDAVRRGRTVLFSLDAASYPMEAAKIGAWVLLDLVRVAGLLQAGGWGAGHQAYFVIDEFSALREEGRHVVPVLARAREAGIACVVATQGLGDLERVDGALPQQMVQNVGVRVMLRQGSAEDAEAWARHAGGYLAEEASRRLEPGWGGGRDSGFSSTRWRREYYVSADDLHALGTGEAVVWTAPIAGHKRRIERIRIAPPAPPRALLPPGSGDPDTWAVRQESRQHGF